MKLSSTTPRLLGIATTLVTTFSMMDSASAQFVFGSSDALDLEGIKSTASETFKTSECGIAVIGLVDTFTDGACPEFFNSILGFLTDVPLPSIDISGNLDFDAPALPNFFTLDSLCDAGGCVLDLSLALDEVDDACFDTPVPLTKAQRNQIRLLRAMIGVTCLRDTTGDFCIPKAIESFVDTARDLVSGAQSVSTTDISGRNIMCQPCGIEFQKEIFSVFDVDGFSALSQMACLKDQTTGDYCPPDELFDGFVYAIDPLSSASDTNPALCSSCTNQAIGLASPLVNNNDYPLNCYGAVSENKPLEVSFDVQNFETIFPTTGDSPQDSVRADCAAAFGLPPDFIQVTAKIDFAADSTRFTCTVTSTLADVPVDQADLSARMENSPMTNLNEDYNYLAKNELDIMRANPVDPAEDGVENDDDDAVSMGVGIAVTVVIFVLFVASIAGCVFCCVRGYCCCNKKDKSAELPATYVVPTTVAPTNTTKAYVVDDTEQTSNV